MKPTCVLCKSVTIIIRKGIQKMFEESHRILSDKTAAALTMALNRLASAMERQQQMQLYTQADLAEAAKCSKRHIGEKAREAGISKGGRGKAPKYTVEEAQAILRAIADPSGQV